MLYRDFCYKCKKDKGFIRRSRLYKLCYICNGEKAKETGKDWAGKREEVMPKIKLARKNQVMSACSELKKQKISLSNKVTKRKQLLERHGFLRTPIQRHLRKNFSSLLNMRLKRRNTNKSNNSTFNILGYSVDNLISHLEKLFQPNMNWKNYGQWHIDHIKPDSHFKYNSIEDEEFKKCWALENLQPLWAKDNLKKSDKLGELNAL